MLVEIRKMGKVEQVAVTSLDVASTFEKEHYHVMETIFYKGIMPSEKV